MYTECVDTGEKELRNVVVTVRMSEALRSQVAAIAAREDRSVSTQIVRCLRECVTRDQAPARRRQ